MGLMRYFVTLLVLSIASHSQDDDKCIYEKCDCNIDTLVVTCMGLNRIPSLTTNISTQFKTVIFKYGNFVAIYDDIKLPSNLVNISFIDIPIYVISPDVFQNVRTTLTSVSFRGAKFQDLPTALIPLENLTTLAVSDMSSLNFPEMVMAHIGVTISKLDIQNINMKNFPMWISYFRSLVTLDLSRNPITSIPDDALKDLNGTLRNLILKDTALSRVPVALSSLHNLNNLSLDNNKLADIFDVPCSVHLSLSNNKMSDSYALVSALRGCKHVLSVLTMSSNKLTVIPDFSNMTQLKLLYLDKNLISDALHVALPISLTHLYLQGNRLTSIPTIIAELPKLSIFYLEYIQSTKINAENLTINHKIMYLQYNSSTELTESSFQFGINLFRIHLESNPMSITSPLASTDLDGIKYLFLRNTKLAKIPLSKTNGTLQFVSNRNISTLVCPCPPDPELVMSFSKNGWHEYSDTCSDGKMLSAYWHSINLSFLQF